MEPNLLSPALPFAPGPSGANISNAPESVLLSPEESFRSLIHSALEEKSLRPDEKTAEASLLAMIGYWISSSTGLEPNMSGETVTGGENAAPPDSIEMNGLGLSSGIQGLLQAGVESQPSDEADVNTVFSGSSIAAPPSVTSPSDPLKLNGSLSIEDTPSDKGLPISGQGSGRSSPPDFLNPPVMDGKSVSARMEIEAGTEMLQPDLLNLTEALSVDLKETPLKTGFPASDERPDPPPPDRSNPFPADGTFESAQGSRETPSQRGTDLLWTEGLKDAVYYGRRLEGGSSPEKAGAPAQDAVPLPNSGEDLIPQETINPSLNGGSPAFQKTEGELQWTGATEKAAIQKESLPPPGQKENKQGLESLALSEPPGHPSSNSINRQTANGPPSSPRTETPEVHEQIGRQLLWSLRNNEEKIRLVLEPPELGNIYMEVKREKDLVKATLWTDNPATKEILESHQVQLQKLLKADGFALEKFDVFLQQGTGWFRERREKPVDHGPWSQGEPEDEGTSLGPASAEVSAIEANRFSRGGQYVDLFI